MRYIVLFLCAFLQVEAVSISLSERQLCDLELLMNEGFAPLEGFLGQADYERVVGEMRLSDGKLWPMPIVLDISEKTKEQIIHSKERALQLCDSEGTILATMEISDLWAPNKEWEAEAVYGTADRSHPGVDYLLGKMGAYYVGGKVTKVAEPKHYDFLSLRKTPAELKALFREKGIEKVVAFQTRNPMHRAHVELTLRAAQLSGAHLLLHPAVGQTKPGDVDHFTRVKCYRHLLSHYPIDSVTLSLLPIAMRMAGPREALWHALIRKNHGCTHFIVGRDHAGPGKDRQGNDFYPPYAAQELVKKYSQEAGIEVVPFKEMVYVPEDDRYEPADEVDPHKTILNLSGTELRKRLNEGAEIPSWFTYPEVIAELRKVYPSKHDQGLTLFFTGLSASGKSTIANALAVRLMELQSRSLTILDGDLVRKNLSSELGFSKEHRSLNNRRVGFVANEITKHRGIAICALIAPYEEDRLFNRSLISASGNYVEIYVSTPISVCEARDPKGFYIRARQGTLTGFSGIDDPYEIPKNPDLTLDTTHNTVDECVEQIMQLLMERGIVLPDSQVL
ncbi:MAG: bifunctional sulfate adenylyltransferase/adenylylsulfate kinase [Verrucomicrobiota bacterium]|nr:bifunctional sulfate adenylyltransferase/adenylylsulfate kinase [Verrucomicrobiota bacterium]